jgi:hypothetical protein
VYLRKFRAYPRKRAVGCAYLSDKAENLKLVEIAPIEYQLKMPPGKNPRILRYRKVCFTNKCTQSLEEIVTDLSEKFAEESVMQHVSVVKISRNCISYQYGKYPMIIWEPLSGKIMVSKQTLKVFKEGVCQQQASIFMRYLKKFEYATFVRTSVTFNPERIGKTSEDVETTFRALMRLFQTHIVKHVLK